MPCPAQLLVESVADDEDAAIRLVLTSTCKVANVLLVGGQLKSLALAVMRSTASGDTPTFANTPFDARVVQFLGGTAGDEGRLKEIAEAVMSMKLYLQWLNQQFALQPAWTEQKRQRQLMDFRTICQAHVLEAHPELFTEDAKDPLKWKYHLHTVVRFDDPTFLDKFVACAMEHVGNFELLSHLKQYCSIMRKRLDAVEEAEPAAPATRKRSLEDTAGGAKPQPPKKKRLVDYGEYLVPVGCALFVPVALGFGFVVSHIFLG